MDMATTLYSRKCRAVLKLQEMDKIRREEIYTRQSIERRGE
jgi:hypothetical protein